MCLRGLADLADNYLQDHASPEIQTYVVFVPTLGAKAKDVESATRFLHNPNVHYYWDPNGSIMGRFADAIGVNVSLWDYWSIYRPGTKWTQPIPPPPDFWRHQLPNLPKASRLNVPEFIERIKALKSDKV